MSEPDDPDPDAGHPRSDSDPEGLAAAFHAARERLPGWRAAADQRVARLDSVLVDLITGLQRLPPRRDRTEATLLLATHIKRTYRNDPPGFLADLLARMLVTLVIPGSHPVPDDDEDDDE